MTVANKVSVLSVAMCLLAVLYLQINKKTTAFQNSQINKQVPKEKVLCNCHVHSKGRSPPSAFQRSGPGSAWLSNEVADALHHRHHRRSCLLNQTFGSGLQLPSHRSSSPPCELWPEQPVDPAHTVLPTRGPGQPLVARAGMATTSKLGFPTCFLAKPRGRAFQSCSSFLAECHILKILLFVEDH